jgi:hypothetical protein
MAEQRPSEDLKEERRREIFRALVVTEDLQEMTRAQARRLVARRFSITEAVALQIEREGMDRLWPPL